MGTEEPEMPQNNLFSYSIYINVYDKRSVSQRSTETLRWQTKYNPEDLQFFRIKRTP